MHKKEAIEKIKELVGFHLTNGNLRVIYDGTIGLFDNEMKNGEDFYFIPAVKANPLTLFHNREEVWKLSFEKITAHLADENAEILIGDNFVKHIFAFSEAELVYPIDVPKASESEEDSVSCDPPEEIGGLAPWPATQDDIDDLREEFIQVNNELTTRDEVCIQLRVPQADTEWVNDLIKQSYKYRLKLLSKMMTEE